MREDTPHPPGATVRGYRVERLIGTGGAAAVYEARRLGPRGVGARVACKVVHAKRRSEPLHREIARQEAVLGLRVTAGHRNLVEILDFFDDVEAQHCIVMELVDGASVADLRGPDRRLPLPVVRRVAMEVLEALVYLHGRGVLHRDLSLRNILVTAGGAVKVTDFGIARVMEQGEVHTENCLGTPMYVASEAIQLLPLDARADLFSLGAILYELVAGTPPCGEQRFVAAMLTRNVAGEFAPLPADTPADLAELITGLVRPERDARRPQTAAAALALLRDRGQPVASEAELAGMVAPAQARHDQDLESARPASALPPGHVLAPRDARAVADAPAARVADRVAGRAARVAADAVPHHVSDRLPGGVAGPVIDAVVERVADAAPGRVIDAVVERVADAAPGRVIDAAPGRENKGVNRRAPGAARGSVARRAALVACVLVACVLMAAALLDDGSRVERAAVEPALPAEVPAPVVVPTPVSPVVPAPVPPVVPVVVPRVPAPEALRHATKPADEPRRTRTEGRNRPARPAVRHREHVPPTSELPPWGRR